MLSLGNSVLSECFEGNQREYFFNAGKRPQLLRDKPFDVHVITKITFYKRLVMA